jgi:hypothetical protein
MPIAGIVSGNWLCNAMEWHDCHKPGLGLPVGVARPIKWTKRQADSGLKEGETHSMAGVYLMTRSAIQIRWS